jgi:hypothetical protein
MSTNAHRRGTRHHAPARNATHAGRLEPTLFEQADAFVALVRTAGAQGACLSFGCTDCGALAFRRALSTFDGTPDAAHVNSPTVTPRTEPGPLARALANVDFDLLRLAEHWHGALDLALFHLRERGQLHWVIEAWLARERIPVRVLELVLFRHARYAYPDHRLADLWIERCVDALTSGNLDEGLVESLVMGCPERIMSDPHAARLVHEAARRSLCVRALLGRLGGCG